MPSSHAVKSGRFTLAQSLYGFVFVSLLVLSFTLALLITRGSNGLIDDALDSAVRVRANTAASMLARTIESDWRDLQFLARAVSAAEEGGLRGLMDGMRGDGSRISWIGLAALDGRVIEATDRMLVGADVSQRPWFSNGLREAYAGDVHEAVMLAKLLDAPSDASLRFIDLALPVRDAGGDVMGVVGMHIHFAWAEEFLKVLAEELNLELFLIGSDGSVIVSTDVNPVNQEGAQVLRAAMAGTPVSGRETWADGRDYFSSLVPQVVSRDLPSFGWRLVGRLDGDAFRPNVDFLTGALLATAIGGIAVLFLMSAIYVRMFIRPIEALASSAQRIAAGTEDHYPPELKATAESADFSAALARLQMRTASRIRTRPS